MKQHLKAPDPLAAIASAILTISGIMGFEDQLDLTASELAILLGCIGTIAASARHWWTLRVLADSGAGACSDPGEPPPSTDDPDASDEVGQK